MRLRSIALLSLLQFWTRTTVCLQCHICYGSKTTPCFDDPKSTQVLECTESEAIYLGKKWYRFMYEDPRPTNKTCLAILYQKTHINRKALRSCFPNFRETCQMFEEILHDKGLEYLTCRTCEEDFCNAGRHRTLTSLKLYSVMCFILAFLR